MVAHTRLELLLMRYPGYSRDARVNKNYENISRDIEVTCLLFLVVLLVYILAVCNNYNETIKYSLFAQCLYKKY